MGLNYIWKGDKLEFCFVSLGFRYLHVYMFVWYVLCMVFDTALQMYFYLQACGRSLCCWPSPATKRAQDFLSLIYSQKVNSCCDFDSGGTDLDVLSCSCSAGCLWCCGEADAGGCSGEAGLQDSHLHSDWYHRLQPGSRWSGLPWKTGDDGGKACVLNSKKAYFVLWHWVVFKLQKALVILTCLCFELLNRLSLFRTSTAHQRWISLRRAYTIEFQLFFL